MKPNLSRRENEGHQYTEVKVARDTAGALDSWSVIKENGSGREE